MDSFRAVYRDKEGRTYSCRVVEHDGAWAMVTSDGPQPITHEFQDDIGGLLTFVEYRAEPDTRLHLEPRQPGQSSFAQLQSAHARAEAQARSARHQERQQALAAANQPDAQKIQEARQRAAEILHARKPRGGGVHIIRNGEE